MLRAQTGLKTLAILLGTMIQQCALAQQPGYYASAPQAVPAPVAAPAPGPAPIAGNPTVYPRLNAPLYPSPVQYTPPWTGTTIVTNQALAPHEMLYPHKYRAMYPPFYYKVTGGWVVTPKGVKQHEKWKLEGTEVKVNYNAHRNPLSRIFFAPR
jgi:hypothetical protein